MSVLRLVFFTGFFLFLSGCGSHRSPEAEAILTGRVVKITDGDTFTLLTDENRQEKIRLHGIDCPEKKQPFGHAARKQLSQLIFGKEVKVQWKSRDRYGRILGWVWAGTLPVNEEMLRTGMAWHYLEYDNNPQWAELEQAARRTRTGLWADPAAVAPWDWRHDKSLRQKAKPASVLPE